MSEIPVSDHRRSCPATGDEVARLNLIIQTQADIAAAGGDRDRLMAVIVERAQELAGADGAMVEVREGAHMVNRFGSGLATGFIGSRLPLEGSLSGLCHRTGEILTCADTAGDDRVDAALCERTGIRAMIVVPLTAEGEFVGLLKIVSRRPHAFAEGDVHTLRILAGFIGAAMSQAMARHEAQSLALKASQLAAIVESSTDAIYRMTPTGTIISWNPWAEKLFGYTAEQAIGQDGHMLAPSEQRARFNGLLAQVRRGERVPPYETMLRHRRDRSPVPVSIALSPIYDTEGDVIGVAVIARDISERVETAAELEALRQASVIKDEFIAVASHELRTPLTVIRNAAAILAKGRAGELSAEQATFTTMILRTVGHLSRLVDDLLDLHKLETGERQYQLEEGDLAAMVDEVANGFAPVAEAKGLNFTVTAPAGPLGWRFDADRLAQVLHHLLSNAAKFTPAGGAITLAVARDGQGWRLSVTDTGIGIREADHARIFERFVQVESSLQRESGGSGLGLVIARRIVEEGHGGTLEVASRLGEGSCFTVLLPTA
jgi:PAS domain S-box-containing protein